MIPRTGGQALRWCRDNRAWPQGYCLQYVRSAFGLAARYPSAIAAWKAATTRHTDPRPPAGVPVFWAGGQFGHVAMSAGMGECWSTDATQAGRVDKVRIDDLSRAWRYTYLGWSEDLNGQRIWTRPSVDAVAIKAAAVRRVAVRGGRLVKRALASEVGKGRMDLSDSRLGRSFRWRYRRWQRRLGYGFAAANGLPGRSSLEALGARHHFEITRTP